MCYMLIPQSKMRGNLGSFRMAIYNNFFRFVQMVLYNILYRAVYLFHSILLIVLFIVPVRGIKTFPLKNTGETRFCYYGVSVRRIQRFIVIVEHLDRSRLPIDYFIEKNWERICPLDK